MTLVTVSDADVLALGGALPRQGFIQVWRVTGVAGKLDYAKEAEYPIRGDAQFVIDPAGSLAYKLSPRGVRSIAESWTVVVPASGTYSLSGLVEGFSVDPSTLEPLNPVPTSAAEILVEAGEARDDSLTFRDETQVFRDETAALAGQVSGSAVTATVDPSDPNVLILSYPAFMLDPNNDHILILPIGA